MKYISLGGGCDIQTYLLNKYVNSETCVFSYIWNLDGGLINVIDIIKNNFLGLKNIEDYLIDYHPKFYFPETTTNNKPICLSCPKRENKLINKQYRSMSFFHYELSNEFIDSINRKIERFQNLLNSEEEILFLYYRQYDEPINSDYFNDKDYDINLKLDVFINESEFFVKELQILYPKLSFKLLSLFMLPTKNNEIIYNKLFPIINKFILHSKNNKYILYDIVYKRGLELSLNQWNKIYKCYMNRKKILIWNNPSGALYYICEGLINALRYNNHIVKLYNNNINEWIDFNPDIYIGNSHPCYRQKLPSYELRKNCKIVMGVCFNRYTPDRIEYLKNTNTDLIYFYGYEKDSKLYQPWINIYPTMYNLIAGDSTKYFKGTNNKYDFGFVGGYAHKRFRLDELLLPILSNYSNYKIYGSNWPRNLQITKLDNNNEAKFLSECKILVCISESQSIQYGIDIPERVYKAILSGALVIHDNVFEIEKIISDIVIFNNCNELKEKIDYYLLNEDERKEKANKQYNTVINNYTYFNVIERMFTNLEYLQT